VTSLLFLAALVVAFIFPNVGVWSLFLLFFTGPVTMLVSRRRSAGRKAIPPGE
jgi:hypothetical protein